MMCRTVKYQESSPTQPYVCFLADVRCDTGAGCTTQKYIFTGFIGVWFSILKQKLYLMYIGTYIHTF